MRSPTTTPPPGFIATATLPDGRCKRFRELQSFDGYVAVWRAAGFLLTWHSPAPSSSRVAGWMPGLSRPLNLLPT